jgi:predicted nucleic acid-binding protein
VSSFAECSFLFALYFPYEEAAHASDYIEGSAEVVSLTRLVIYEFHQAVWLAVFRREHGDQNAIDRDEAYSGLAAFEIGLERGMFKIERTDLDALLDEAFRLAHDYTLREGIRSMDTLHLAAAKLLGCTEFLTFDKLQRRVAELEGFAVPL